MTPGKVSLPAKVLPGSAGNSHTAALASDGHIFIWGTFLDSSGPINWYFARPWQAGKANNSQQV